MEEIKLTLNRAEAVYLLQLAKRHRNEKYFSLYSSERETVINKLEQNIKPLC